MKKSFLKICGIASFLAVTLLSIIISINATSEEKSKSATTTQHQSEYVSPGYTVLASNVVMAEKESMVSTAVLKKKLMVNISDIVQNEKTQIVQLTSKLTTTINDRNAVVNTNDLTVGQKSAKDNMLQSVEKQKELLTTNPIMEGLATNEKVVINSFILTGENVVPKNSLPIPMTNSSAAAWNFAITV